MKKLKLKKDLIANLTDEEMSSARGGDTIGTCTTFFAWVIEKGKDIVSAIACTVGEDDPGGGGGTQVSLQGCGESEPDCN